MREAGHIVPMTHPQGGTVPIQNTPIRLGDDDGGRAHGRRRSSASTLRKS